ncbi:ABC transporter substrate-binding protein [Falsirhodobacter halotolerans]|uniref:ABC transporter substrate-binding protein n=1 Tax=Falsirhodobacter halotolerans TaxID=1146892 RepID=UPI001FD55CCA|nr:ABC transporter substrate-binding protein [Falsirhodobacter halotolerans]MCJ8140916.1 ABC transporter substrate-binding protein [Falsirhodobacter halotolerans]
MMNHRTRLRLSVAAVILASTPVFAETPDDQLVIGFSMTNILTLDPAAITGKETVQVLANVYDGLVQLDPVDRAEVQPDLAESWDVSEDGTTITFHLREAAFASGNPVRAEDVVWSLTRLMTLNLAQASFLKTYGFTAEGAAEAFTAPDDRTVVVTLPQKVNPEIIIATLGIVGPGSILDSELVKENARNDDWGGAWLAQNSAGSAAFNIQQWQSNNLVLLTRNDNFWGEAPAMRRIIWRHIPESQSQRLQLERGDLDIAFQLAPADLGALENTDGIEIQTVPSAGFYYLAMSMKDERFQDPKVREAMRYLIDYDGLNEAILPFYGTEHQRPISGGFLGLLDDPGHALDPEKAKALLAEAGYADGMNVTLRALSDDPFLNLATALQGTLAQGGIRAEVITGSGDQIYGAMRERNFEMIVGRGGGGQLPDPDSNMRALIYNPDNSDEARLTNFQGWRTGFFDEEINSMIDAAAATTDRDERIALYADIQNRYEEEAGPIIPFSEVVTSTAYRDDLAGLTVNPSWSTDLSTVTKTR